MANGVEKALNFLLLTQGDAAVVVDRRPIRVKSVRILLLTQGVAAEAPDDGDE